MSDFLTRLAERQLGLRNGVQPRLPSLFEPVSRLWFDPPVRESQFGPTSSSSRALERRVVEREDEQGVLRPDWPTPGDRGSSARSYEANGDIAIAAQPLSREATRASMSPPAPALRIEAGKRADGRRGSADDGSDAAEQPPHRDEPARAGQGPLPLVHQSETTAGTRELPKAESATRPVVPSPASSPPVLPRTSASEERIVPHTLQTPVVDDDPVVKVTIGRVEIRAVMGAPTRTERRTPERPKAMSLEKYLERGRGGRH
jgi:hypothetical protein